MFDWLDDALRDSSEIITASRRLARVLQREYASRKAAQGHTVWRSATILSVQDWLSRLLADNNAPGSLPVPITAQQSRVLWERCLRREIADPLLNIRMLARQSRETWNRMQEWQVPVAECRRQARNRDQVMFASAAKNYLSILKQEGWIDDAGIAGIAAREILAGRCRLPHRLTLAGFDRLTPQLQSLVDAVQSSGSSVHRIAVAQRDSRVTMLTAENADGELRAAGAWAREQLTANPDARLAIVVTQLEQHAERSLRLIKEGLIPGWQNADAKQNAVINVSYGKKLIEYPAVAVALLSLRWLFDDLSTVEVSWLLRTTLLGAASNDAKIRLELQLRQQPDQSWSPKRLLAAFAGFDRKQSNGEALNLIRLIATQRERLPKRLSPAAWVGYFDAFLQQLHWPGDATLQSTAFQLVNRWRELLNDFARLELVSPSMTPAEALGQLSGSASEIIFQAESLQAAVQVMGPLEAAGLQFDRLWVAGVSSNNWPPNGRPLVLVSRDLQREFDMPDATPAETLAYAERVITRLLGSAGEVVLSYARSANDAQQSASEILQRFPLDDNGEVIDPGWHARSVALEPSPIADSDDPVPRVQPGERLAGGAATLQRQFEEPFAAFVIGRLGVRPLWPVVSGLPPNIRGSLMHAALHHLYEDCPSSVQIGAWSAAEIDTRSGSAAQAAFAPHEKHADAVLKRLLQLEKLRVERLLREVIALDAQRNRFRIDSVEKSVTAKISELWLRLRIDRVDIDEDGEAFILDYKTGAPKKLLDRAQAPKDMQLVVYSYALDQAIGGFGLLNIDSRAVELVGAGRQLTPNLDWDRSLGEWHAQVEVAARQIAAGDVRINAQQSVQDARPLGLLSRYQELARE